ncbi:ROK family protein [uncultured Sunxiuqinia sp.]|uniref:ROK family protein n=1 Tax=Sunxiuqinia rutila TaxID=1397841 RepID=UPI00261490B3|nr:ROK family protein [uncultured Sunxiuqinia sp.]
MKMIGVDIGGTKIEAALIDREQLIQSYSCPTPSDQTKEQVVQTIGDAIEQVFADDIDGIGIGVPGLVDLETNEVLDVVNIPSWDRVPLKQLLEERFNRPVFVNNDANCFAVGENYFGKGQAYDNFVGITLGTGLGAGIIINSHLYSGRFCGAGEFGALYYQDKTLEAYASGQFFKDRNLSGKTLAEQAEQGNEQALQQFHELGEHIGRAIGNVLFALAPQAIILGGSVSQSFHLFEAGMRAVLENEFPYQRLYQSLQIEVSDLANGAVFGASSLVMDAVSQKYENH